MSGQPPIHEEMGLRIAYPIVDAGVADVLGIGGHPSVEPGMQIFDPALRHTLTTGSCLYILSTIDREGQSVDAVRIIVQAIGERLTVVELELHPKGAFAEIPARVSRSFLFSLRQQIWRYFRQRLMEVDTLAEVDEKTAMILAETNPVDGPIQQVIEFLERYKSKIPDIPNPATKGWKAVFDWDKRYGRLAGITSDKELAEKLLVSHGHVRKMRAEHGEPRRNYNHD